MIKVAMIKVVIIFYLFAFTVVTFRVRDTISESEQDYKPEDTTQPAEQPSLKDSPQQLEAPIQSAWTKNQDRVWPTEQPPLDNQKQPQALIWTAENEENKQNEEKEEKDDKVWLNEQTSLEDTSQQPQTTIQTTQTSAETVKIRQSVPQIEQTLPPLDDMWESIVKVRQDKVDEENRKPITIQQTTQMQEPPMETHLNRPGQILGNQVLSQTKQESTTQRPTVPLDRSAYKPGKQVMYIYTQGSRQRRSSVPLDRPFQNWSTQTVVQNRQESTTQKPTEQPFFDDTQKQPKAPIQSAWTNENKENEAKDDTVWPTHLDNPKQPQAPNWTNENEENENNVWPIEQMTPANYVDPQVVQSSVFQISQIQEYNIVHTFIHVPPSKFIVTVAPDYFVSILGQHKKQGLLKQEAQSHFKTPLLQKGKSIIEDQIYFQKAPGGEKQILKQLPDDSGQKHFETEEKPQISVDMRESIAKAEPNSMPVDHIQEFVPDIEDDQNPLDNGDSIPKQQATQVFESQITTPSAKTNLTQILNEWRDSVEKISASQIALKNRPEPELASDTLTLDRLEPTQIPELQNELKEVVEKPQLTREEYQAFNLPNIAAVDRLETTQISKLQKLLKDMEEEPSQAKPQQKQHIQKDDPFQFSPEMRQQIQLQIQAWNKKRQQATPSLPQVSSESQPFILIVMAAIIIVGIIICLVFRFVSSLKLQVNSGLSGVVADANLNCTEANNPLRKQESAQSEMSNDMESSNLSGRPVSTDRPQKRENNYLIDKLLKIRQVLKHGKKEVDQLSKIHQIMEDIQFDRLANAEIEEAEGNSLARAEPQVNHQKGQSA